MRRKHRVFKGVLFYLGIGLLALITLLPFLWMISSSFKSLETIRTIPIRWIPEHPTLEGYRRVFNMMAVAAWVCRKPHLLYEDTEVSKFSLNICRRFSSKIITPRTFLTDLGPKQERVDTYKELFYLHPDVFTPDREALKQVGFNPGEPYVLVRFVAWNASHDVGKHGLTDAEQLSLVRRLEAAGVRVWVSSEKPLSPEMEPYRLRTPFAMAHHGGVEHIALRDPFAAVIPAFGDHQAVRLYPLHHETSASGSVVMLRADGSEIYNGGLKQIRGRGNSTWGNYPLTYETKSTVDKKPYQITLSRAADLLDTGDAQEENKRWILLAEYYDATMALESLRLAGHKLPIRTKIVKREDNIEAGGEAK